MLEGIKVLLKKGTTVNAALLAAFEDLYKKTIPDDKGSHYFKEVYCKGRCFKVKEYSYLVLAPTMGMPEV